MSLREFRNHIEIDIGIIPKLQKYDFEIITKLDFMIFRHYCDIRIHYERRNNFENSKPLRTSEQFRRFETIPNIGIFSRMVGHYYDIRNHGERRNIPKIRNHYPTSEKFRRFGTIPNIGIFLRMAGHIYYLIFHNLFSSEFIHAFLACTLNYRLLCVFTLPYKHSTMTPVRSTALTIRPSDVSQKRVALMPTMSDTESKTTVSTHC